MNHDVVKVCETEKVLLSSLNCAHWGCVQVIGYVFIYMLKLASAEG